VTLAVYKLYVAQTLPVYTNFFDTGTLARIKFSPCCRPAVGTRAFKRHYRQCLHLQQCYHNDVEWISSAM